MMPIAHAPQCHQPFRHWGHALAAGLAALLCVQAVADDAADVRGVMDCMTAAVLAGDKAAYLACVDDADPVFRVEQVNWAADFDRHKVGEFVMSWEGDSVAFEHDEASGDVKFEWKIAEDSRRSRSVSFPASFVRRDGAWKYAGEKWIVTEAPGVRVCFPKGLEEVAGSVAAALPEVREHVHRGFEIKIDRVQVVKLYASMRHLQHSIYLSYDDGLSGWNEPEESVKIMPGRRAGGRALKGLLAHEYGHVCTFELGPRANAMPWWILEGVAELSAEEYLGKRFDRLVKGWARAGTLADWSRLADFHNCTDEDQVYVYNQGHHMVAYISERFGRPARNAWMKDMAVGATLDEATRSALGMEFGALDLEWRDALRRQLAEEDAAKTADQPPPGP